MKIVYRFRKDNQRVNALSQKKQNIPSGKNKRIQEKEFQILKPSYSKNNKERKIKWIITIKINSTAITDKRIIKYQGKERSHLIFDNPPLQSSSINAPYIKPRPISLKKPTLIKPSTMSE